jgi:hypothetical protein
VGVTATANIGMNSPAQLGARGAAAAKASDQPQQPFSESLATASKAYSETDRADGENAKTTHRQKSSSEDEKATDTVHRDDVAQFVAVSQQVVQPQQVIPAQPAVVQSSIDPSGNDPSQAGSIQSGSGIQNIITPSTPFNGTWNSTSGADANEVQNATPTIPPNDLPGAVEKVAADTDSNAVPSLAQDEAANAVQNVAVNSDSSALPEATQGPVLRAALSASTSAILASTASDTPADQAVSSKPKAVQTPPASDLNVSSGIVNQTVSPIQQGNGLPGKVHAGVYQSDFGSEAVGCACCQ